MASDRVIAMKNAQAQEDMARNYTELSTAIKSLELKVDAMLGSLERIAAAWDKAIDHLSAETEPQSESKPDATAGKSQKKDK